MFDFLRKLLNRRKFKKNLKSRRYRYADDGITKIYVESKR